MAISLYKCGMGVKLTTRLHVMLRLRMVDLSTDSLCLHNVVLNYITKGATSPLPKTRGEILERAVNRLAVQAEVPRSTRVRPVLSHWDSCHGIQTNSLDTL